MCHLFWQRSNRLDKKNIKETFVVRLFTCRNYFSKEKETFSFSLRDVSVVKNRFTTETYWEKGEKNTQQIHERVGIAVERRKKNTSCQFYNAAWAFLHLLLAIFIMVRALKCCLWLSSPNRVSCFFEKPRSAAGTAQLEFFFAVLSFPRKFS